MFLRPVDTLVLPYVLLLDYFLPEQTKAYGETMAKKAARIRRQSVEGARDGWTLERLIVKSNDDVRQEVFIMQVSSSTRALLGAPCKDQGLFIYPSS